MVFYCDKVILMSDKEKAGNKSPRVLKEEEILEFWKTNEIFKKTLEKTSPKGEFVFYEGPPTANGRPGIHHLESRAFKDAIPRYRTMRGYRVRRKGGWDTHGLPVEIEVEKSLGITSKKEIEEYGIDKFNQKCKENVWKYIDEWDKFTNRVGYWADFDDPYVTYYPDYMESLWWIVSEVHKRGLLYKDYKVLPWCPRCGTALSSHELAQGYKDVKDLSVTVKFELVDDEKTYVLAWTTTPWTLPGNVALAVGEDILYTKIKIENEYFILAKERLEIIDKEYEVVEELYGKDLIGKKYKPLFPFLTDLVSEEQKPNLEKAYKVYPASFVTTEDGTGVVHTAVMYGQDDFVLGTEIGLPKHHLVHQTGHFVKGTGFLEGKFVKDEATDVLIIKDLAHKGLLFAKSKHEHSYPFCWRCKTPLIYFARDSWYIKMSALQSDLIKENQDINWEPDHLKEGRFGEWLEGIRDWAISRERYWGTPLPVWLSDDGDMIVVDSFDTLRKFAKKSGNEYFVIRHGEADSNVEEVVSDNKDNPHHLTEKGKEQVTESLASLKNKKIDLIISSPFVRTKETAEMVADGLGIPKSEIIYDERIGEIQTGGFNLKSIHEFHSIFDESDDDMHTKKEGGETLQELKVRMGGFLYDIDEKYEGKKILIITHGSPSWMLFSAADGLTKKEIQCVDCIPSLLSYMKNAEVREMPFTRIPHNELYERDLHRPYVDEFYLYKKDKQYKRVLEVMDVWFDSGCMPFAQDHYPFENEELVEKGGYPADYISEAIDQTRGWFYTLHAVGVLLGRGKAYKNVISLGLLMDEDGQKMSKSKGNTVNPFEAVDKHGADVLRMWMYSVNQPGESKNFDDRTVDEVAKKIFNLLENVVRFYETYSNEPEGGVESDNPLDKWIISRLSELSVRATDYLDNYKILEPTREIRDFIADLSQWYIRRSRDRFKGDDLEDKKKAIATTKFVLIELSKILAPFTPFIAESIYQKIDGEKESVHLEDWSEFKFSGKSEEIIKNMKEVREIVTLALDYREKAGIKVRQPLDKLKVKFSESKIKEDDGLINLIKDEVNVKQVAFLKGDELSVEIDTEITAELQKEGDLRELLRSIQGLRKEEGLDPLESLREIIIETNKGGEGFIKEFEEEIKKQARVKNITFGKASKGKKIIAGDFEFTALIS